MIYTYDDVCKLPNYKDGDYRHNLLLVMRHVDPNKSDSFDNWVMYHVGSSNLSYIGKCVCSHVIKYVFHAIHIKTMDIITLGSDCISQFDLTYDKITNRLITLHKKPDNVYCLKCNKKITQKIIDKYPDEEIEYHKSCFKKHRIEIFNNEQVDCELCTIKLTRKELEKHMEIHKAEIKIKEVRQRTLTFGKFAGKTLLHVYTYNRGYVLWLAKNAYSVSLANDAKLILTT